VNDLRDEAVVLRTYRSGEADRIVVLWTREHGKVRAIAKGIRKPTSKIGGALEPMAHVQIFLGQGRGDLAIVRQVSHLDRFVNLRASYDRLTHAMALLEVVDAIPLDDVADEEIFVMLVRALRTLDSLEYFPELTSASFFLKLLVHDGSGPVLHECVSCGSLGPLVAFDAESGGVTCENCRHGRPISLEALELLQRIMGGDLANVLREKSAAGSHEVNALAHEAIERHLGRRLKVLRSSPSSP
jgi:DNA repair protein RecO (recombination protein O)